MKPGSFRITGFTMKFKDGSGSITVSEKRKPKPKKDKQVEKHEGPVGQINIFDLLEG
ncbi:hypothetical protein [Pontibacillus salipaludis]|uniref:Uncharacterized protein n=1 Tax=Pontibacillus salipaludis TaxID=1697394 RepID=A0ABQ1PWT1_9BACI|nr:hypothetical protein [Pontibacillus salipaludis]GGD05258.1 hypothetical protein GCM10011389_10960 [Pontibacillus salipaludis]